jgi:hypothetical protein
MNKNTINILNDLKHYQHQRFIESTRTRYTISALSERIKKDLASVTFDINHYIDRIGEHKKKRPTNQSYYDYDLELDFSIDTQEYDSVNNKIYDDRWYYYKAYHFFKLGLFLKKDAPSFKVKIDHLSHNIIYELRQLDKKDRRFVLKQAVSRIFEDINFDLYYDSISNRLEVILVS